MAKPDGAASAPSMQSPNLAFVRHALPGDPIELVLCQGGKEMAVAVSERNAVEMISSLARAVSSNMTAIMRRDLVAQPKAGSRG